MGTGFFNGPGKSRATIAVTSVANLRNMAPSASLSDGQLARIKAAGSYEWDSTSVAADNSTTVIKPNDVGIGSGRWVALTGAGSQGAQGAQGAQGTSGSSGAQGAQGAQGSTSRAPNVANASRDFALTDADKETMSGAVTLTIRLNATVAFPVGTQLEGITTTGQTTFAAEGGVTLNIPSTFASKTRAAGSPWTLYQSATNVWYLFGDLDFA